MSIAYYDRQNILENVDIFKLAKDMEQSFRLFKEDRIQIPEKGLLFKENPNSVFISMQALSERNNLYIHKSATFFARGSEDNLPSTHAVVSAFCNRTGQLLAILNGEAVTMVKCAAISALITAYCAAKNASVAAIIGSGTQAKQQFIAITLVRDIKKVKIYSRNSARLGSFIKELECMGKTKMIIEASNSVADCIESADVIATTTSSAVPLHDFDNLRENVHINCVGAHTRESREIAHSVLQKCVLIVEDKNTAIREAGQVHSNALALPEFILADKQLLRKQQTIFSSTGYAYLDLITIAYILRNTLNSCKLK